MEAGGLTFRHWFNLICAPLSTGPGWQIYLGTGYLNYFRIIKSKGNVVVGVREREAEGESARKQHWFPMEQITSVSAPETGGDLPDRAEGRETPTHTGEGERGRWADLQDRSNFLEVNCTRAHAPANYISWARAFQRPTPMKTIVLYSCQQNGFQFPVIHGWEGFFWVEAAVWIRLWHLKQTGCLLLKVFGHWWSDGERECLHLFVWHSFVEGTF